MARDRLIDRFVRLCEIPSPTGAEREIADAILAELRSLGVAAEEDVAAAGIELSEEEYEALAG